MFDFLLNNLLIVFIKIYMVFIYLHQGEDILFDLFLKQLPPFSAFFFQSFYRFVIYIKLNKDEIF